MTWIAPGFLLAGLAAAIGTVALHLIMHRLPPVAFLPTARVVPPGTARAVRRAMRPDDIPLLALRVAMLLLAAAALARPVLDPERRSAARVVVLDQSRAVADIGEVRDSGRTLAEPGDIVVAFDSSARVVAGAGDSLVGLQRRDVRGNLAGALVAAIQAAPSLRDEADSVEIVLVSPFLREEMDDATLAVRAQWPGRVRLVRVAADTATAPPAAATGGPGTGLPGDDPLAAALRLRGTAARPGTIRILRTPPAPDDSAWARQGGVLVHWPAAPGGAGSEAGAAAGAEASDSIGAVIAEGAVVVAAFARSRDPSVSPEAEGARSVAWWADGQPAASERPLGEGCVRDVLIAVPSRGDLVLRASFARLLHALTGPCGGASDRRRAPDELLANLSGTGPLAASSALPHPARQSALAPWLLAGALLLALAEPFVRRQGVDE